MVQKYWMVLDVLDETELTEFMCEKFLCSTISSEFLFTNHIKVRWKRNREKKEL